MISKDQIKEFSKRFAIDEYTIIREYIQIVFLSILYRAKESSKVYFKGGTAIRLLLKSSRFSEDLDFTSKLIAKELDSLVSDTTKEMSMIIPHIVLKRTDENKFAYTGILGYKPEGAKHPLNIHLDFSLREKPETSQESVLETDFPVAPLPIIRHMDLPEILAEKIRAFICRSKGRDVYDLWFMLSKGIELDWKMINRKLKLYHINASLEDTLERINEFDEKQLKNDLGKFLPTHERGLALKLKNMTIKQLTSRKSFMIIASENIDYTKVPGHSFSGTDKFLTLEDMKNTKITSLKRQNENNLAVMMIGGESVIQATAHIRARNRNGVRELHAIEKNANGFKGKSYDDFIHHTFIF